MIASRGFLTAYTGYRAGLVSGVVLGLLVVLTFVRPLLPLPDPAVFGPDILSGPSARHLLGTDNFGRDLLSRVVAGTQTALLVAVASALLTLVLGVLLGSLAGYRGGWLDDLLSRIFDVFVLIPAFFLLVLVVALFGPSLWLVIVVIGLTSWPSSARIMRSQVLTYRTRVFVEAARAAGGGSWYLLRRHVVPNGIAPVITNTTILMGQAILTEAGLSFLGLSDPSTISWGRMVFEGQQYLSSSVWMSVVPGVALLVTVMCLNLTGDGLAFAFAPGARGRVRA
ncbi:ABC transporter permease [Amycolatopsis jejuensis]|uniref:ABC transporter permease n=1 Tax=Amycolatopsis jejuensis TaxID=330084 RepID=UPI000691C0B9|nr:ABC transporter permease [Amycolatopsis jejuensis]